MSSSALADSEFSPAQFEALIQKIEYSLNAVVYAANSYINQLEHDVGWMPGIGDQIMAISGKFRSQVEEFCGKVKELLKESHVPLIMWEYFNTWAAVDWQLAAMAASLNRMKQQYSGDWQGSAASQYQASVSGQVSAVAAVGSKANSMASTCKSVAEHGQNFYLAVGGIVVGAIIACAGGPAALAGSAWALYEAITNQQVANEGDAWAFKSAEKPDYNLDGPGYGWPEVTVLSPDAQVPGLLRDVRESPQGPANHGVSPS